MESIAVAYVPVVHKGYRDFFDRCRRRGAETLYLLGPDFTKDFPELARDLRALSAEDIRVMIDALGIFRRVDVLHAGYTHPEASIIFLPEESVSRAFAAAYLQSVRVEFISVFLRWDMYALSIQKVPEHHRTIAISDFDREVMRGAYAAARRSPDWWRQIGAVLVKDGTVLRTVYNKHLPHEHASYIEGDPRSNFEAGTQNEFYLTHHAEKAIICWAARNEGVSLEGAYLYVTTFPCAGCARDIARSGISRLYYAEGYSVFDAERILARENIEVIWVET